MIQNVQENGPNEASNTNTKLPDLKGQKFPKKLPKMYKMTLKCPKMAKMTLKWPKMTQNDQKWSKNSPKWSEMFKKIIQMRPVRPTPNYLTYNSKLPKKYQKWAKQQRKSKKIKK